MSDCVNHLFTYRCCVQHKELTESYGTSNFGLFSLLFPTVIINFSFYFINTFINRISLCIESKADISRLCSDVNLKIIPLKNKYNSQHSFCDCVSMRKRRE